MLISCCGMSGFPDINSHLGKFFKILDNIDNCSKLCVSSLANTYFYQEARFQLTPLFILIFHFILQNQISTPSVYSMPYVYQLYTL